MTFWAERVVSLLVLGTIILACFWIAWPLLGVLAWGAMIAIALAPAHRTLAALFGGSQKAAATLIALVLLILLMLPLSYLPGSFQHATREVALITNNWTELRLPPLPAWIGDLPLFGPPISERWSAAARNSRGLLAELKPYVGPAFHWLAAQGASLSVAVFQILLSIILAGVFLSTEASSTSTLHRIASGLGGTSGEFLLDVAVRTIRGVAKGVIGTALIQGALSGIGFAIAGVPFAVGLGVLSFGTAMLQIGTWLVWIPAALWLSYNGQTGWALFTTAFGVLVNVIDNIIKPLLIGRGAGVPVWVLFVGVIGGVLTIGLLGIFIGPVVMAVGYTILTGWLAAQMRSRWETIGSQGMNPVPEEAQASAMNEAPTPVPSEPPPL